MGEPQTNSWPAADTNLFGGKALTPGPRFAKADWFSHIKLNPSQLYDKNNLLSATVRHRPETIDLDLPIKKQLRRINGTPVVLLLFPIYINDLNDNNNTLSKIIETFKPFPQVKFMFSNTWDMGAYSHPGFNALDYILDSVKDIDSNRLNFYLCNKNTVDAIKSKRPDVTARVMANYFNRIIHYNRVEYKHNPEQRSKHFLCLNNGKKYHRTFIVDRMPPEHSYVSYVSQGKKLPLEQKNKLVRHQSMLPYWQDSLPHFYYNDSYINIVNETMHELDYFPDDFNIEKKFDIKLKLSGALRMDGHFTEKSLKPIYFRQMFLIIGYLGANKTIQDLGFKLFDNFIDYSFDSEENPILRLKRTYVEIKRLTDISITDIHAYYNSTECQDIIEHNLAIYKTYCYNPTQELISKYQPTVDPELTLPGWAD